ncbi:MAG TPA: DUF1385 domain-containing protein [Candidatus Omnitrophota bacterium]|jgi:uncharacterized protein YqhQ|nr:DUF1385 domain-containing protein [Candidatus Omnitrophota bacterium]
MPDRYAPIGGQAVIEGVMMRSPQRVATAVRLADGTVEVKSREYRSLSRRLPLLSLPILRGAVVLVESLRIGVEALAFSAEAAVKEDEVKPKEARRFGTLGLGMGFTVLISFALGFGFFFWLPLFLTDRTGVRDPFLFNLIDGFIRLVFFLIYIVGIGFWGEMQRVFQYHGAEHKTIHNLESGLELTPENASKQSRFHPRCGTSFLFLVVLVSFIVFAFLGRPDTIGERLLRFGLIPVIAGISFEIIRFAGAHGDKAWVRWISEPGLQLQRLTTREPSRDMLEVAIAALRAVL